MYILVFFLVLGMTTYMTNKTNDTESNSEFLHWSKKDILIIASTFGIGVLFECLKFIPIFFLAVYFVGTLIALVYVNKSREQYIIQYKKQIEQISESVAKLTNIKELDFNDLPFDIFKSGDKINKIVVHMKEPGKFNDGNCSNAVYSLKRYFPYFDWKYSNDFPKQICTFEGMPLPPSIAMWPGSDTRSSGSFPFGLAGSGEVLWNVGKDKNMGWSEYVYEDGTRAGTNEEIAGTSAPQMMVIGSTGGGKSIWVDQEIW